MRGSRLFFGALMAVIVSTTYVFVRESSLGPRFRISNDAPQNIEVTAAWRDQVRDLGIIEPGATKSLTVRDEATMIIGVRYSDGREAESNPVYFTSGTTTNVDVSDDGIFVEQDADN